MYPIAPFGLASGWLAQSICLSPASAQPLIRQRDDIVMDPLLQLLDLLSRCLCGEHALGLGHGSIGHCCRERESGINPSIAPVQEAGKGALAGGPLPTCSPWLCQAHRTGRVAKACTGEGRRKHFYNGL